MNYYNESNSYIMKYIPNKNIFESEYELIN